MDARKYIGDAVMDTQGRWKAYGGILGLIWRAIFRRATLLSDPDAPNMSDWSQVLAHWGLEPGQEEAAARFYGRRVLSFFGLAAVAIFGAWANQDVGHVPHLIVGAVSPVVLLGLFTNRWRQDMMIARTFCPIWTWLCAGCEIPKGFLLHGRNGMSPIQVERRSAAAPAPARRRS